MGLLDKLKDAGKTLVDTAKDAKKSMEEYAKEEENAIYLDEFDKNGSVESDALPATKNSFYFSIDVEKEEITIVEYGHFGVVSTKKKNKLIKRISLNDIAEFKALNKERRSLSTFDSLMYECEIICNSGECYKLCNVWFEHHNDTTMHDIISEMEGNNGLNIVLLFFAPLVSDNYTKQWYNEIYSERGTGPVFDENGAVNLEAYLEMHKAWYDAKHKEWNDRLKAVKYS